VKHPERESPLDTAGFSDAGGVQRGDPAKSL
jgi:hypothetical protein